ncbi:MAG TPA: ATP synthase F1 subunit gamma [Proteobacteria bacterium]|nr:ATP synthase F1 subunit gamma [Pseudomonadota bacterium]
MSGTLRALRRRLNSVKTTQKITRAMKIVAAAKLQSAETRLLSAKPYSELVAKAIRDIAYRTDPESYPLLAGRSDERVLEVLVVSADRGLCGAFNSSLLRFAEDYIEDHSKQFEKVQVSYIGRKAQSFFKRGKWTAREGWINYITGKDDYARAVEVADNILNAFYDRQFDRLHVVYNRFVSRMAHKPCAVELIPLSAFAGVERGSFVEFRFEPNRDEVLRSLLVQAVRSAVFDIFLESFAAEQSARMMAMDNATRNAEEMIDSLTLTYNRARQESITKELMDIVNGAEALKRGGVGL